MGQDNTARIALISVISNMFLVITKFIIWFMTGSVSIISEALHSCMDLLAACIAFFSIKYAGKSPDEFHNYWYGKIENVSGVAEALLIFIAVGLILYESIEKFLHPWEINSVWLWFAVMIVSWIINFFVSQKLFKEAKKNKSVALEADAVHLRTDTYSSLGVWLWLLLIRFTWIQILDPIVAVIVALFISVEAWAILKKAFLPLLDISLPKEDIKKIKNIILKRDKIHSVHKFYSRTVGKNIFIEFDLVFDSDSLPILEAHNIWWQIKKDITDSYPLAKIRIHLEPFSVVK